LLIEELEVSDIQARLCSVRPRPARHDCPHIVRKTPCDRERTPPRLASRENAMIYSLNSASANGSDLAVGLLLAVCGTCYDAAKFTRQASWLNATSPSALRSGTSAFTQGGTPE